VRSNTVALNSAANGMIVTSEAVCDVGERLLSGGFTTGADDPKDLDHLIVIQNGPLAPADLNGWIAQVRATAAITSPFSLTTSVLCLTQP
jgi:hypothetical protein